MMIGMPAVLAAVPIAILRWLMLAGLAGALGGLAGRGLARQYKGTAPAPLPAPWALRSALLGAAATAALTGVVFMARALLAGRAHPAVAPLLTTGQGELTAAECVAFLLAAAALRLRRPGLSVLPLAGVIVAEGIRAHPEGIVPVGGALLTCCHLTPAVMWAGMLLYTLRAAVAWRHDPAAMRGLVRLYANAAVWLFGVVVLTGVITVLVLVPLGSLVSTAYGIVVIVKAVLVAVVAGLAIAGRVWLNRPARPGVLARGGAPPEPPDRRFAPRPDGLARGGDPPEPPDRRFAPRPDGPAGGPAQATVRECCVLGAVLAITAVLTVLTPPAAPARAAAPASAVHLPGGPAGTRHSG